jgi:protein ImuB
MRTARVLALSETIQLRVQDPAAREAAREALRDVCLAFVPAVQMSEESECALFVVSGVGARWGSEEALVAAIEHACHKVRLSVITTITSGAQSAIALTHRDEGVVVHSSVQERQALSPLPLHVLPLDAFTISTLHAMGIRTLGELAKLDAQDIATRAGPQAAQAARVAKGEDRSIVVPQAQEDHFEERVNLDWELCEIEPLLFATKPLFTSVLARLSCRGFAARTGRVRFFLLNKTTHDREVTVASATREVSVWMRLLHTSLQAAPPKHPVIGVSVELFACAPRAIQLGLFDRPGPSPEKWSLALARIESKVGASRVGIASIALTHRPREVRIIPWQEDKTALARDELALDDAIAHTSLALHVFRPPQPVNVRFEHGAISAIAIERSTTIDRKNTRQTSQAVGGRVLHCAGPYRTNGSWWDNPFAQDTYDIVLEDAVMYRVGYDPASKVWTLEGRYE